MACYSRDMTAPPLVLVHGYLATASQLIPMQRRFQKRGLRTHLVKLSPLCIQDVRKLGKQLDDNIRRICAEEGCDQVDIVGVSLGGILGLRHAQSAPSSQVRRLVTIGTPFRGTWVGAVGLPLLGAVSRGIWQTLPTSDVVRGMVEQGAPTGVQTTSISMKGDLLCSPSRCRLPGADHVVLDGLPTVLTHQYLVLSRAAFEAAHRSLVEPDLAAA